MGSEYEKQRLLRLQQNHQHMVGLGLFDTADALTSKPPAEELPLPAEKRKKQKVIIPRERPRRNVPVVSFKPVPRQAKQVKVAKTEEELALEEASKRRSTRLRARPVISFAEDLSSFIDEYDEPSPRKLQEEEEEEASNV